MSEYLTPIEADMLLIKAQLEGCALPELEVDYGDGFEPIRIRRTTVSITTPESNSAKIRIKRQKPRVIDGVTMPMHVLPEGVVKGALYYYPDFYYPAGFAGTVTAAPCARLVADKLLFYKAEDARAVTRALKNVGFA